ncbi:hypothetical protein J3R82DRAFT_6202 [Butyriboletus roseoflavus]|nr:hypothetical protein J3R82DRAFT_6202 [Butyriboletus roseoflavus]
MGLVALFGGCNPPILRAIAPIECHLGLSGSMLLSRLRYYDACTIITVPAFGQDPAQWPPVFDAPRRAT